MREERLAILTMVSEGKITADEGAKLLEAMSQEPNHSNTGAKEDGSTQHTEANDDVGAEIRDRLNNVYKDFEPRFRRNFYAALESALETATLVSSTVRESINEGIRKEMSNDE